MILAPAGNKRSFLAALAAGAEGVYCGLKKFSARMAAHNFSISELSALTGLARNKGVKVYITFNSLLKPGDLDEAKKLLQQLQLNIKPDAIIIQDLALIKLARQVGFSGEIHLSTLANVSFTDALPLLSDAGVDRVVLPRELNVDEVKMMATACRGRLDLEIFVHGALCYGVSGRCYWSSWLGGKSGLRGRCVQPCRRVYRQGKDKGRFFSCRDLRLEHLVKVLLPITRIRAWKIEGRKKGPHYVYHTVRAYRMLRDQGTDPQVKKKALAALDRALGRVGTHYYFLPQRPWEPIDDKSRTGSGLIVGKVKDPGQRPYFITYEPLLSGDMLRIGYEDDAGHAVIKVGRYIPKKGRFYINISGRKKLTRGTPVFLIDRLEKELEVKIGALDQKLPEYRKPILEAAVKRVRFTRPTRRKKPKVVEVHVHREYRKKRRSELSGYWLTMDLVEKLNNDRVDSIWWLPPVVWPSEEDAVRQTVVRALKNGYRKFVLNAVWQIAFFQEAVASPGPGKQFSKKQLPGRSKTGLELWAGPFCNLGNAWAVDYAAEWGFYGVIVSPELSADDYMILPGRCKVPLGIIISANWPLCVSRTVAGHVDLNMPFTSPFGEHGWISRHGSNFWVYPNWKLDLTRKKEELQRAGYSTFFHLWEPIPQGIHVKSRQGLWNWETGLH
jgi:putative protease